MYPYHYQNTLPPQQILQANGKASINALRMAPNSSALIADQTQPIVWKCTSDSLGNVSAEAFDITPHKDEATVEKEALTSLITEMNERLKKLEVNYESFTGRSNNPANAINKTNAGYSEKYEKPTGVYSADDEY